MRGTVKWYNHKTGIGFVTAKVEGEYTDNILIHYVELSDGVKTLNEGDTIEFELNYGERGLSAKNICLSSEGGEKFIITCPKCRGADVSFAHTLFDEIRIKCENKECQHKEYT